MSFETITISPIEELRRKHHRLVEEYLKFKRIFLSLIEDDDEEAIIKLIPGMRKAYCEMKSLFWKIKEEETQIELKKLDSNSIEYYELCIRRFECYDKSKYYESIAQNKEHTYIRCIKPVVAHKIQGFKGCISSEERMLRVYGEE